MRFLIVLATAMGLVCSPAYTQDTTPGFWGPKQQLSKPDLSAIPRLRFLTTTDFFPFNFIDDSGRLSGFHVDLARRICSELDMSERCQIQALPWEEIETALENRDGEAIVAGLSVNAENRGKYLFSHPYMRFPARLVTRSDKILTEPLYRKLEGMRVGAVGGTMHEELLRDLFPEARTVTYSRQDWLLQDLKGGKIDAAFGDGMRFSFWLAGEDAAGCCVFSGGPYPAPEYLGHGLAIAVPRDQPQLVEAIDFALHEIETNGSFAELYLRYFPVGFY